MNLFLNWLAETQTDTIISLIALCCSVYSIGVEKKNNRRLIQIVGAEITQVDDNLPLLMFTIRNISRTPITVTKIQFFYGGVPVHPELDHSPELNTLILPEFQIAEPLDEPYTISPFDEIDLSYYLDRHYPSLKIIVHTKERVRFRHSTSVFIDLI